MSIATRTIANLSILVGMCCRVTNAEWQSLCRCIPEIIEYVQVILDHELVYVANNSVYFNTKALRYLILVNMVSIVIVRTVQIVSREIYASCRERSYWGRFTKFYQHMALHNCTLRKGSIYRCGMEMFLLAGMQVRHMGNWILPL